MTLPLPGAPSPSDGSILRPVGFGLLTFAVTFCLCIMVWSVLRCT